MALTPKRRRAGCPSLRLPEMPDLCLRAFQLPVQCGEQSIGSELGARLGKQAGVGDEAGTDLMREHMHLLASLRL